MPNATAAVMRPATNGGTPKSRLSAIAAPTNSARSVAIAITSVRQPLVDDLTVRQTGAIAYALSGLVDARVTSRQEQISNELRGMSGADLEHLDRLDVSPVGLRP